MDLKEVEQSVSELQSLMSRFLRFIVDFEKTRDGGLVGKILSARGTITILASEEGITVNPHKLGESITYNSSVSAHMAYMRIREVLYKNGILPNGGGPS